MRKNWIYLQDISQYTASPHISVKADRLTLDDFRSSELGCACTDLYYFIRIEFRGETKVDQFHIRTIASLTHNVLGLDI